MPITVTDTSYGVIGTVHKIDISKGEVLIFQLPRPTRLLSRVYVDGASAAIKDWLPDGSQALVIGSDVDVYALCGEDAITLKLKGII